MTNKSRYFWIAANVLCVIALILVLLQVTKTEAQTIATICIREWDIDFFADNEIQFVAPNQPELIGGAIDLRGDINNPPNDSGLNVIQWGIFAYSTAQSGPDILVCFDDLDKTISGPERAALASLRNVGSLRAQNPRDAIFELMTESGDTSRINGFYPLWANKDSELEVYIGGELLKRESFNLGTHPATAKVLEAEQEKYRAIRSATLAGRNDAGTHQRYLTVLKNKYGVSDTDQFIPPGLPKVAALPHRTSQTEDFDCGDNEALDCDLDWTTITLGNDIDLISSTAQTLAAATSSTSAEEMSEDGVSSDDHFVEADVFYNAGSIGIEGVVTSRKECGTLTRTWYKGEADFDADTAEIGKREAGSSTGLDSDSFSFSAATTYTINLDSDGTTHELFIDTVSSSGPVTNGDISGFLCGGMRGRNTGFNQFVSWNNWVIDDGVSAGARRILIFWPF